MRLLRVIHSMKSSGGGPAESVRQFSRALEARGCITEVATLDAPRRGEGDTEPGIHRIWRLGPGRGSYGYSDRLLPWLAQETARFDGVIIQGLWNYHSFATWKALKRARRITGVCTPYWIYTHGMLDPWFKQAYPLKHLKKALYWHLVERRVLRDAKGVLFTADEERLLARQSFANYHCNEVVVPHGIESPSGDAEKQRQIFLHRWPELQGKRIILFLGRLHPKKGPELALQGFAEALSLLPAGIRSEWALVMAGAVVGTGVDESYGPSLQTFAQTKSGLEGTGATVVFTGSLQGEMKWGAFHGCEAFVLPSHQENFGIAVVEALACGKPVLISDKVNIWREILDDGAALVAPDTLEGTRSLMERWLALPEVEKVKMGENARRCFSERFEIGMAAKRLMGEVLGS